MNGWIDCRERLPEPEVDVEVWLVKNLSKQGVATAGRFADFNNSDEPDGLVWMGWENEEPFRSDWQVTHWRPLLRPHRPTWLIPSAEE
ncbi:hypothetical protein PHLH8_20690 [Pseudomonas sp. Pc102]|uniref:DUF551 domain-containing protein n=1 Tax=Pseudomonas sp. Pc102 TaxID=2678261 RepID=UPI001BCC701D|nr:DUF551 domain-containing protein [Pseudomonas sp. Pc102]BBP82427.1 hypothetical protein PHLH8_20690 [Pseudomonas sp. Pc102]